MGPLAVSPVDWTCGITDIVQPVVVCLVDAACQCAWDDPLPVEIVSKHLDLIWLVEKPGNQRTSKLALGKC